MKYTREVCYVKNDEICAISDTQIELYNTDGEPLETEFTRVEWDDAAAEKGGYAHFMLKEMHEQPKVVRDTFSPRIKNNRIDLGDIGISEDDMRAMDRIHIVACGSAE